MRQMYDYDAVIANAPEPETVEWVFGYGSIVFRQGFEAGDRVAGFITDWRRVFYQNSTGACSHFLTVRLQNKQVYLTLAQGVTRLLAPAVNVHVVRNTDLLRAISLTVSTCRPPRNTRGTWTYSDTGSRSGVPDVGRRIQATNRSRCKAASTSGATIFPMRESRQGEPPPTAHPAELEDLWLSCQWRARPAGARQRTFILVRQWNVAAPQNRQKCSKSLPLDAGWCLVRRSSNGVRSSMTSRSLPPSTTLVALWWCRGLSRTSAPVMRRRM